MFEHSGGGRQGCLSFQLWITDVYHVDNFWLVDKLWIVKNLKSYPQFIHCGRNATERSYPQLIHIESVAYIQQKEKPG